MMNSEDNLTFTNKPTWWSKQTKREQKLMIWLSVSLFTIASLAASILIIVIENAKNSDEKVCSTPGCIHAASFIIENMDDSVDPCEDFYDFVCGSFVKDNIIPEDKLSIDPYETISDNIRDQLKLLLEEKLPLESNRPNQLIKIIYDICMNTTAIEDDGLTPIKSLIKEVGGWPLLEGNNWNEEKFDWKTTMYKFRKLGLFDGYFLDLYVCPDEKNSTKSVFCLDEGAMGLNREFLIKGLQDKLVQEYYNYAVDIARYFGAHRVTALNELKDALEFEIQLAKISTPKEDRRNSTLLYNPMTIDELNRRYPRFPWLEYVINILGVPKIKITDKDVVIVAVPNYINKLEALLQQTPKRVQANYIIVQTIGSVVFFSNDKLRKRQQKYMEALFGSSEQEDRWKECINLATDSIELASGAAYVRHFFNNTAKQHVEALVSDIQNEFVKSIEALEWMDDSTKKNALEKAQSIIKYIGFPDELLDDEKVEKFYSKLNLKTDNYLNLGLSIGLFYNNFYNGRLREPINKTEWIAHSFPTTVNAFYDPSENSIEFPAGILQGSLFRDDRPRYLNYGSLGYIVGHEITHGFDDEGRQYDKDGNLNDWWKEETKAEFIKRAECIISQYGNFSVPEIEMNLNGISGQGENIADNGGVKQAYLAYNSWIDKNGPELKLPGLNYNPHQLFWISAANSWCSKDRKEFLKLQVTTGYHSPTKFRVNGPFQNSKEFAKDFNCPIGSPMNPENKCVVW